MHMIYYFSYNLHVVLNKFKTQSRDRGGFACKTTNAVDYKREGEIKKLNNKHNLPA